MKKILLKQIKGWILHAVVPVLVFFVVAIVDHLLHLILSNYTFNLGQIYISVFSIATIMWEVWQKIWKNRKLDTIIDVLIANTVFVMLMYSSSII